MVADALNGIAYDDDAQIADLTVIKRYTAELLQGVWIVEVGELGAMRGADVNKVKQLMSQQIDRFRAAYARHVKDCPRCCVFFGTSNDREYLQDKTGNRRFWPVDAAVQAPVKSVFNDLEEEVDQLWAEAVTLWSMGEPLFLSGAEEAAARIEQQEHLEKSPWEGTVLDFLEKRYPQTGAEDLCRKGSYTGTATFKLKILNWFPGTECARRKYGARLLEDL